MKGIVALSIGLLALLGVVQVSSLDELGVIPSIKAVHQVNESAYLIVLQPGGNLSLGSLTTDTCDTRLSGTSCDCPAAPRTKKDPPTCWRCGVCYDHWRCCDGENHICCYNGVANGQGSCNYVYCL